MPQKRGWTEAEDAVIRSMRAAGCTWQAIGDYLDLPRNTVLDRGRRLNAAAPEPAPKPPPEACRPACPLPAGHPWSWRLLTAGTLLDGVPYRYRTPAPGGGKKSQGGAEQGE